MALFKCKMCGGTIEFEKGDTVGVCDSCGTKQTLPKTHDDVIANLFNRQLNDNFRLCNIKIHNVSVNNLLPVHRYRKLFKKIIPKMLFFGGHVFS